MTAEEDEIRTLSDVHELVRLTDLRDVVFHELLSERTPDAVRDTFELRVVARQGEDEIGVRCRVDVAGGGGTYVADGEAIFALSETVTVDATTLRGFVERVGLMVIYPYLRVAITEGAAKLALKQPVLKLLRAGEFQLESGTPETHASVD